MKWIVLIALLGSLGPLTMFLRSQPKYLLHACFFMGLLVFFLESRQAKREAQAAAQDAASTVAHESR